MITNVLGVSGSVTSYLLMQEETTVHKVIKYIIFFIINKISIKLLLEQLKFELVAQTRQNGQNGELLKNRQTRILLITRKNIKRILTIIYIIYTQNPSALVAAFLFMKLDREV